MSELTIESPACPQCKAPVPLDYLNAEQFRPCQGCAAPLLVELYPAIFRPPEKGSMGDALVIDSEASCFFHTQKKAVVPCQACGRFLCALCDVEFDGQHLCPPCLESASKKGKIKSLEQRRTLHDSVALALALLPLLIFYITFITAPLALYWAIRHWNTPSSVLQRSKIRLVLAIFFSVLQIAGWIILLIFVVTR